MHHQALIATLLLLLWVELGSSDCNPCCQLRNTCTSSTCTSCPADLCPSTCATCSSNVACKCTFTCNTCQCPEGFTEISKTSNCPGESERTRVCQRNCQATTSDECLTCKTGRYAYYSR